MANNNDLKQLTNQEVILEEINEEELGEVVGGLETLLGGVGKTVDGILVSVLNLVGGLLIG